MSDKVIGKCGNCGGQVVKHDDSMRVGVSLPCCNTCGATPKATGTVIEMNPAPKTGKYCSFCGQLANSAGCQRSHP